MGPQTLDPSFLVLAATVSLYVQDNQWIATTRSPIFLLSAAAAGDVLDPN